MTIADRLIPAFYIVEIEGASLEHLINSKHQIKRITISSRDMKNDLEAYAAMDKAIDSFKNGVLTDKLLVNPEFFPSVPPIDVTAEMEELETKINATEEAIIEGASIITRRFDEWGDFVSIKRELDGDNLKIRAKVAVHPRQYVREKQNEKQEQQSRLHGQKFFSKHTSIH